MHLFKSLIRKFRKLRLQPVSVLCFHHVCSCHTEAMKEGDWMPLDEFKSAINEMRRSGTRFLSLSDAVRLLRRDFVRRKKYAVLTFDDGYSSIKDVLPWLESEGIPVTLFVNGKYLDGHSFRDSGDESYLTRDELFSLTSPLVEIGHHGWEHVNSVEMTTDEFRHSVDLNVNAISGHPRYIPYWSYTWGSHNSDTDQCLKEHGLVPVLMDGVKNYACSGQIHRELL